MWWSGFPPLHGNISWGPISSFLESAGILWSHVAYQQYHGSSYKVMSRTPKYPNGKRLGNRAIWTSGCRIQTVSKVVRPCERRRNSRVWWSSNGEWQTHTCEFCSGIFPGYRNEAFQWVDGRRSHRTSHVSNVSQWAAFICYEAKGGPISFGVRPNLLISCCTPAIPCFHLPNWMQLLMWCQGRLMGERLGNRAIWTSGCRIQTVSKDVKSSTSVWKTTQLPRLVV